MKFSRQAQYAVILASELAMSGQVLSLTKISEKCQISYAFLRKVANKLTEARIIHGLEGKNGGYVLSRNLETITLSEILMAVDEQIYECSDCNGHCDSANSAICPKNSVLFCLQQAIENIFEKITLDKLICGRHMCTRIGKRSE